MPSTRALPCPQLVAALDLPDKDRALSLARSLRGIVPWCKVGMELFTLAGPALLEALRQLKEPCAIDLYSDSQYVINGLEKGWAKGWRARGWKKADKSPALNPDLWAPLLEESEKHKITYHWLKGHAGHALHPDALYLHLRQYSFQAEGPRRPPRKRALRPHGRGAEQKVRRPPGITPPPPVK